MKFTHLPVDGGLYDQHPVLLEKWQYIFAEKGKYEKQQQKKQEQEAKRGNKRRR